MTLTAAVGGCPLCSPYRGALLSGRYPHNSGVPCHQGLLPADQPTIADAFNDAGYRTAYFGKWHVGGFEEGPDQRAGLYVIPPEHRGHFDDWVGYENNNSQWDCWVHGGEGDDAFQYRLPGYETDALTDLFIDYLTEQGKQQASDDGEAGDGKPFFAALSVQPPHNPYVAPAEWMDRHTPGALTLRANVPDIPTGCGESTPRIGRLLRHDREF